MLRIASELRHRSYLLDLVEQLFDAEFPVVEHRPREIVEIRFVLGAMILLYTFPSRHLPDDWIVLTTVDTRHRFAEADATESFVAFVRIWEEHFDRIFVLQLE